MGCEYPAKCSREGICKCAPPFRDLTEEEFWVDPMVTSQCQEESFSLWKCKGVLLAIPIELQTTTPTPPPTTTTQTTTTTVSTTTEVLTTTFSTSTEAKTEILTTEAKMVTTTEKIITTPKTAHVLETCMNHEQCPVNARCRPNACEGFVCLCNEGHVKSRNGKSCVKAVRIGEVCDVTKTTCMSPFSGCSGVCQCYDGFEPSNDGRCKLQTASFAGERCGTLGCEHPAKCVNGFCQCSIPFRNMTTEEFWINPLETSQCHSQDFSLIKCRGQYINVPEDLATEWPILVHKGYQDNENITTTTSTPTTFSEGPITTPVQWFNSINIDLIPTTENGTTQVYNTCLSHTHCPSNSMCRPNACDGFVCLCNKGYVATTGYSACLKAALIGEPCDGVNSKCLSPFATCTGTCKCHHPYVETSDGRCKLKSAAFLSETCGGRIGCEHPGVCEEGICKCHNPYRKPNEDEFWVNPSTISQCMMGSFSLMKCDGKIIDVPEELVPEWADYLDAISKAELRSSTPNPLITTPKAERLEKTTVVSRILPKSAILESCGNHEQCPDNARCHPNSCKGFVCLCNEGYLKSWDGNSCLKAVKMGDSCDALTTVCMSPFSQCSGVCRCYDGFIASNDGRCKLKTTAFIGEECATLGCEHPAKCVDGICRCVAPFRNMTKEEFWVNPLETSQCHQEVYSLIKCNGGYIKVPKDLRHEWPVLANNENTNIVTSTTSPATSTVNAKSQTAPWYQIHSNHGNAYLNQLRGGNATKEVYTTCSSHTQCPPNSKCRPNACEGFICLCDKGYVASTGKAACIKASLIGEICDDVSSKCLSPFATCAGSCQCFPPYHETKDGRCKLNTAAFLGEPCGGRIGCEHPGICERGICKCQSPYRKMNEDEFWVNPSQTSQCRKETFSLMKCKGTMIDVPDELLPEWQHFIESLSSVETTTKSTPNDGKLNVGSADLVTSSSSNRNISLNSEVKTRLYSSCVTHDECPSNAKCRPKSCEGYVCICNMGYMSSVDKMSCQIASRIGEKCDDKNHRCLSPFSACAGSCRCYDKFVASKDGRCKLETTGFLGDRCGGRMGCEFPAKCSSEVCQCATPYRKKTVEEFWTDPSDSSQCLAETFSLRECNGKPITVPPRLKVDTFYERDFTDIFGNTTYNLPSSKNSKAPGNRINMKWDLFTTPKPRQFGSNVFNLSPTNHSTENKTDANSGVIQEQNGQTGSSETQHATFIGGGSKNVLTFIGKNDLSLKLKVNLHDNCIDHKQCPSNSICRPMSCDGYICLCRDGYLPSHDGKKCMKAVPVGEKCDDTTQCLSPFATCRGVCKCYDAFMTTQDGRCQIRTAGFIGDDCGGRIGCEYPAQCAEGTCKCEDPYRRLTRSEFWADPTRTRQCHRKDFSLHYCNGLPLQIPNKLNNETSQLLPGGEDFFQYEPQGGFHEDIIYFKAELTPKTITLPDLTKDNRSLLEGSELKPRGSKPSGNDRGSHQNGINLEPSYTQDNKNVHMHFDGHGTSKGVLNSLEDKVPSLLVNMGNISGDTHDKSGMNNDLVSQTHSTINDGSLNSSGGKKDGDLSRADIKPTPSGSGLNKGGQGDRHIGNRGPGSRGNENDNDGNGTNEIDPDKEKPNSSNESIVPNSILIPSVISAAILINLVCLILIVTARRRRKRQNRNVETESVQKPQYEQIKPEMFRIPRPLVATPSDDLESGYSSLQSQNKDKQEIIDIADANFTFENIRIPRPELKEANEPRGIPRVRKRSRTIHFTTTDSFSIENNWFDKIPRPLLSLSPRLLRTENWGTWPKVHTNPYNNAFSAPSDDNTYDEICNTTNRETSV